MSHMIAYLVESIFHSLYIRGENIFVPEYTKKHIHNAIHLNKKYYTSLTFYFI